MQKFNIGDRVRVLISQDKEAIREIAVVSNIYDGIEYGVDFEDEELKELQVGGWLQDVYNANEIELVEDDSIMLVLPSDGRAIKFELDPEGVTIHPEHFINIRFQEGTVDEVGVNGCQIEDVIDLLVARLEGFQKGGFPCRENALAITKLEEARMWLNERTRKRKAQGVEGRNMNHD